MMNYTPTLLDLNDDSYPELFKRYPKNPIITAKDLPYPAHTIFNPGATAFQNNTLLIARVENRQGFSHLTKAISKDGVSNWIFDKCPTIEAEPNIHPEEKWGIGGPQNNMDARSGEMGDHLHVFFTNGAVDILGTYK